MPSNAQSGPKYIVEKWPHGWLMRGPQGRNGIPAGALSECAKLFPKDAVVSAAIASHYRTTGHGNVVFAIATPKGLKEWAAEIETAIAAFPAERRWFCGIDTGMSSMAMFAVLAADMAVRLAARQNCNGQPPYDADDFGRCRRLIERFPEWRARLPEVGAAYPNTKWPQIVARWDELEAADPITCTKILSAINYPPSTPPTHA